LAESGLKNRSRTDVALRLHRLVLDHLGTGILLVACRDQSIVQTDDRADAMFGYKPGELVGRPVSVLRAEDDRNPSRPAPAIAATLSEALERDGTWSGDCHSVRKDRTTFWTRLAIFGFDHPEFGEVWVNVQADVTRQREVERKLYRHDSMFRALAEASRATITVTDSDGFIYANPRFEELTGYTQAEIMALRVDSLVVPEYKEMIANQAKARIRGEPAPSHFVIPIINRAGERRWLEAAAILTELDGRTVTLSTAVDITERERALVALKRSREGLRNLAVELQRVREEERSAISRKVHDQLGQALAALKMDVTMLATALPAAATEMRSRAATMTELLGNTIQMVRNLSAELRYGMFDELNLTDAIEEVVADVATRAGLDHEVDLPAPSPSLSSRQRSAVLRTLQEALTNAMCHGHGTRLRVALRVTDQTVVLEVSDDGRGIASDAMTSPTSLGLIGMRERALSLGGTVTLLGRDGVGTTVTLTLPRGDDGG
jgi:PAS domain S-box-containing protein